ncbi:MAG: class II fumarate hydratase [Desulfobacterota bacterium]|nr:class II fumarate hydratase [Thermodesulfobacteriota bacterium]
MVNSEKGYRIERDSMGPVRVLKEAYYGGNTKRAIDNFPVSGYRFGRELIHALGLIKYAAARANAELGLLDRRQARAIEQAAYEVMQGKWDDQFVIDVFQTGSGTSTHMNANEVIANRANEILGGQKGTYHPVHPNDHVNLCQSSNDVFPSALHIAAVTLLLERLLPALTDLHESLDQKAKEFYPVLKIGRTHLQDALPIRLGQEFEGYAQQVRFGIFRILMAMGSLYELPLGGTAVGTGANTHPLFAKKAIAIINKTIRGQFRKATSPFEAQGARDASVEVSGALKTVAVGLLKIANDIRWLGSGPRCGLGEIHLPEVQPGSSMMPGKVNPVIPESLIQVCAHVIGSDTAITLGGLQGYFELNTMMPLIAFHLLESIRLLANGVATFNHRCVKGLKANRERCEEMIEKSLALVTALAPTIGYEEASRLARRAYQEGKTIRQIAEEEGILPKKKLDRLLNPVSMLGPRKKWKGP